MGDARRSSADAAFYDAYWRRRRFRLLQVAQHLKLLAIRRLVREVAPGGGAVLDVGCGAGELAASLARCYDVSALDFSPATIERNAIANPRVRFFVGDALAPPPPSEVGRYDVVTCMDVIEHIPYDRQADLIANLASWLKADGWLVMSTPDREQALRYKRDASEPDEAFLQRYEGQPRADLLTGPELDALLAARFEVAHRMAVAPTAPWRPADLAWKAMALLTAYRGVNRLTARLGAPGRYLIRAARRTR